MRRPDSLAPGFDAAEIAGNEPEKDGDAGGRVGDESTACDVKGVAGVDGEGDCDSTTHIR